MNNVLLWVGGLLVAVLALLFAVPYAVDWNSYRGVFEEEASRLLGRDVRVGGRVDLRLLPKPYVKFEKIRIADLGAMQGEPFFRAENFTMWLSIPPLLRGAIEANDVELDRPTLSLAVDHTGVGNWRTLRISPAAMPFVPSDVALQAVRIRDGAITFRDIAAGSSVVLSDIDGELAAPALNGPFRFRGDLLAGGQRHEVRLNTTQMEADGRLRLKATVRTLETQNNFALDATLAALDARPRIEGTLTAKLPLSPVALGGQGRERAAPVVFELQSQLAADSRGARLAELALGFEQDGRPQLLTGTMATTWGDNRTTTVELASKWLDLDRIADAGDRPLDAVREFASRLASLMPQEGTSKASIAVDQVNLGGDAVSDVRLALVRRDGTLALDDLSGAVPGNGRLAVRGRFGPAEGRAPPPFDGTLTVRGASLQRFVAWAFPRQSIVAPGKAEAPFALAGALVLAGNRMGLTNASLELPAQRLQGGVTHRAGDVPELAVTLEGDAIDLSLLAPELIRLDGWQRVLEGDGQVAAGGALLERKATSGVLRLDVRAGKLGDGATVLHDVTAAITSGRGRLEIPVLRLRSAEGLALDATAQLDTVNGRRHGTVTGWASAPSSAAAAQLVRQVTALMPATQLMLSADIAAGLAPLDIGFTAQLAKGPAHRVTVTADGIAAGSRIVGRGMLDGGIADWRKAPVEIGVEVHSPDIPGFMARLHGRKPEAKSANTPGTARIKLAGASAESIAMLAGIDSAGVKTSFVGRVRVPEGATSADLQGDLQLDTADAAATIALIEPDFPMRPRAMAAKGTLGIARAGNVVRLMPRGLDVGGARLGGDVSLAADGAKSRITGRLSLARASLADLMSATLDQRAAHRPAEGGPASLWPEAPFDFSGLDGVEGKLRLAFAALDVGDGLVLSDADLDVELGPGRIDVSRVAGRALDGAFAGRALLERTPGGAALKLAGKLGPVPIASALGPVAGAPPAGTATLEFDLQGRAASPRGLVTALAGKGTAELAGARIPALQPAAIDTVADQLLESTAQPSRSDLEAAMRRALIGTQLDAGAKRLAIEVSDASARIAPLEIAAQGGRAANTTTVDLLTLKADSEWTLTSTRRTAKTAGELPAVTLVYVGPLKDVLRAEPRVSVEALEREITVRRMERDVERLEQLRRQDEERARKEREGAAGGAGGYRNGGVPVIEAPLPIPAPKAETAAPAPVPAAKGPPPARTEARPRSLEDILQAR